MGEHYFEQNPSSDHERQSFKTVIAGESLSFFTDRGVFSKDRVDYGSRCLIESFAETYPNLKEAHILELGSGYGPVVTCLGRLYPESYLYGVEINERAHQLANENLKLNNVSNVELLLGDATGFDFTFTETFDFVLTNPPIRAGKETIQAFVSRAFSELKISGELWLVIAKKQGAPSMSRYMEEVFGNVSRQALSKGYWVLKSEKFSE